MATKHQVYVLESSKGKIGVCVPVAKVDAFDAFLSAHPEALANIEAHTEQFDLVIVAK